MPVVTKIQLNLLTDQKTFSFMGLSLFLLEAPSKNARRLFQLRDFPLAHFHLLCLSIRIYPPFLLPDKYLGTGFPSNFLFNHFKKSLIISSYYFFEYPCTFQRISWNLILKVKGLTASTLLFLTLVILYQN